MYMSMVKTCGCGTQAHTTAVAMLHGVTSEHVYESNESNEHMDAGASGMPAFGMAVFKSPPQSRSPSLDVSLPPSAPLSAPAAALNTTAAPAPATAAACPVPAAVQAATADGAAVTAAVDDQPSGSKRKRAPEAVGEGAPHCSTVKQSRLDLVAPQEGAACPADTAKQPFDLLKSHK